MKVIHLKCGHKIKVKTWPSRAGMAKMRRHYKKFHPTKMKAMTKKSLATKRKRGLIGNRCNPKRMIRRNVPPHIKDEILKWHWAGKKHVHITNLINKKYGLNLTVANIRKIVFGQKNPSSQSTLIYDKLLGIEARKQHGKFKGENFRHDFKHDTDAVVMGNPDGSLTIRSKKGKRLWKKFNY